MLSGLAGGYTCGKWTTPTAWVSRAFNDRGYAVASVGYRLQPHASLADMVGDTVAAAHWCRANLPSLVGADPDGWAVGGASSGATLAGMAAHIVQPPPKAFLNVYGLVDVANYRSEEAGRDAADWPYLVASEDELAQYVADGLAHPHLAQVQNPWAEEMPPHVSLDEARHNLGLPDFTPTRDHLRRVDLYTYVAKHRNLIDIICRRDQYKDDEAGYRLHMENLSPHHVLHYKDTFPPTWFMHGTSDNIIPADQSRRMADKLKEMGVATGEHWEEGAGHVYDFAFEVSVEARREGLLTGLADT